LQTFQHVAIDDALRQTFDDRRFAEPEFDGQYRVVLGAAQEHLNSAGDFLVPPDDWIKLAIARLLGLVLRISFNAP
jgi:hypothetical protein